MAGKSVRLLLNETLCRTSFEPSKANVMQQNKKCK
jgi:hypothetical protein